MLATSASVAIVIDANVAVWAVVPTLAAAGVDAAARLAGWNETNVRFVAPVFWLAECTSALRAVVYMRKLSAERARLALSYVLALEMELIAATPARCDAAFLWAG